MIVVPGSQFRPSAAAAGSGSVCLPSAASGPRFFYLTLFASHRRFCCFQVRTCGWDSLHRPTPGNLSLESAKSYANNSHQQSVPHERDLIRVLSFSFSSKIKTRKIMAGARSPRQHRGLGSCCISFPTMSRSLLAHHMVVGAPAISLNSQAESVEKSGSKTSIPVD